MSTICRLLIDRKPVFGRAADHLYRRYIMAGERMDELRHKPATSVEHVDLDVLENLLSFYIRAVNIAVSQDLDRRLEGLEVARGTGKVTLLLMVDSHPGIRPSVIAQLTMKDRSAMGRLVEHMVDHGLITRETSVDDSRARELYITPAGAELARKVRNLVTDQSREFFGFMPEDEQKQLMEILKRAYRRILEGDV